jgi:hypothetical protein
MIGLLGYARRIIGITACPSEGENESGGRTKRSQLEAWYPLPSGTAIWCSTFVAA